ncbi:MAG: hypothetical protein KC636_26100 [Myxococcales bacterium]|nr:hypothetical protein [Myxococcales bacterium]
MIPAQVFPEEVIPLVIVPALFFTVGVIYWLRLRSQEQRAQLRHDLGVRTIERFTSAEDLTRFFESAAGQTFVQSLENNSRTTLAQRLLMTMRVGIVFGSLGLGFLVLQLVAPEPDAGFVYPGVLLGALGIGFIAAAVISHKLNSSGILETKRGSKVELSPYRDAA